MNSVSEFRRLTEEANQNRDSRGRRYSPSALQLAIRYHREQRAKGRPLSKIAQDRGINVATLRRWLDNVSHTPRAAGFREVALVEKQREFEPPSIQVTLANGLRIDGLKRSDVIELVKALA